ncbi:MAG: branched-chain amino acid ABC transporter permease [Candidatus Aerophobetes bacterium]|nr:branched-chain amino acid ABC transporter permease [Candidatus Aerophobetes bacterium]
MVLATEIAVSGILMGSIFALVALGLSLVFGVMNIVNFAHGEFLMIGMYSAFLTSTFLSIEPLVSLPFVAVVGFLLGIISYYLLIRYLLRGPMIAQLFGTFGLMLFLRYLVMFILGPSPRAIHEGILIGKTFSLSWLTLDISKLAAGGSSIILFVLVSWMIERTRLGRALRATSIDAEAAGYMGINTEKMNALAWGIGGATVGIAGGLLANFYYITPTVGMLFCMIAFATVALGGFGSIKGAFLAGLIVGLIMMVAGQYLSQIKLVFVYLVYFLVVVLRPKGLFGW